jgi:hypothetical protein
VHPHQTPTDLIELAAAHLRLAAADAARRSDSDPFSPWHAYAGQLDLAAAALSADPGLTPQVDDHGDVLTHLDLAFRALDHIPPGHGPTDLALWCWHLAELLLAAKEMAAT